MNVFSSHSHWDRMDARASDKGGWTGVVAFHSHSDRNSTLRKLVKATVRNRCSFWIMSTVCMSAVGALNSPVLKCHSMELWYGIPTFALLFPTDVLFKVVFQYNSWGFEHYQWLRWTLYFSNSFLLSLFFCSDLFFLFRVHSAVHNISTPYCTMLLTHDYVHVALCSKD